MSVVVKERKVSQSAPSKIDSIVRQLFIPMLGMPTPPYTSFVPEDCEDVLLRQVAQDRPDSMVSEAAFIESMVQLYRKFQTHSVCPSAAESAPDASLPAACVPAVSDGAE